MIMILLAIFLSIYVLWIFYLAVMNLKRAKDAGQMTKTALILGYPIVIVGYLFDVLVNIFVITLVFVELPHEWTVTARLSRLKYTAGWRAKLAKWFCENLLDQFDPSGCHCK